MIKFLSASMILPKELQILHGNSYQANTFFILMDYPIHIDAISMEYSILYFIFKKSYEMMYFSQFLKIVFILSNSADSDELHLGDWLVFIVCLSTCLWVFKI